MDNNWTEENKDTVKKYLELLSKIKGLIRSANNNKDNYEEKYMKIKFNSGVDFPLIGTLEIHDKIIAVTSVQWEQEILSIIFLRFIHVCTN